MPKNKEILTELVENVLSDMAFLFCDPVEDDFEVSDFCGQRARMLFHGQINGDMTIWLENSIIKDFTANILGLDDDSSEVSEDDKQDALKELLNVLVGQFVVAVAGEKPIFDLSVPIILGDDKADFKTLWALDSAIKFLVDDRPVIVTYHCEASL